MDDGPIKWEYHDDSWDFDPRVAAKFLIALGGVALITLAGLIWLLIIVFA